MAMENVKTLYYSLDEWELIDVILDGYRALIKVLYETNLQA
jgi:hypothetical protein